MKGQENASEKILVRASCCVIWPLAFTPAPPAYSCALLCRNGLHWVLSEMDSFAVALVTELLNQVPASGVFVPGEVMSVACSLFIPSPSPSLRALGISPLD